MRHIPPLASVRVFEAAARHENFTQAAAELGMTQAAVSYQIRLLEDRLGLPLFVRSRQRVALSEAGRRIAPLVAGAFDTLSDAFSSLVDEDETILTISAVSTFAANWLAPRLGAFQIERPELAVRLQTSNAIVDFAREDVDVAIRMGLGPWPGLRQDFLFRSHVTPLCSPEFRDRHAIAKPEDLLRVPQLSPGDIWWTAWLNAAEIVPLAGPRPGGIRLDSQLAEGNAALAGHGVAMISPIYWRFELAAGRLVQLFPKLAFEGPSMWLVYPEYKRARPKIRAFREWLLREIADEATQWPAEIFVPPAENGGENAAGD